MAVIKTRFGNLNLQSTTEAVKVDVTATQPAPEIKPDIPLLVKIAGDDSTDVYKINTQSVTLTDVLKSVTTQPSPEVEEENLIEGLVLKTNNKLAIDTSKLVNMPLNIPIATEQKIGGVRSIDSTSLPLLNSIKVHKEPVTAKRIDGTEVVNVEPGWMEVNALSTDKLEQLENHWLILDSVNAAADWDGSEAK